MSEGVLKVQKPIMYAIGNLGAMLTEKFSEA